VESRGLIVWTASTERNGGVVEGRRTKQVDMLRGAQQQAV